MKTLHWTLLGMTAILAACASPTMVGTYMNANEAIAAAENRKVHLTNIMNQKGCGTANKTSSN